MMGSLKPHGDAHGMFPILYYARIHLGPFSMSIVNIEFYSPPKVNCLMKANALAISMILILVPLAGCSGTDPDTDGDTDGVPDSDDDFPNYSNETTDSDGDGVVDNSDENADGDGDPDSDDDNETADSDGDGEGDNSDEDADGGGGYGYR